MSESHSSSDAGLFVATIGNWQLAVVVSQNQVFPAPETKDAI
jgi:hypothetical protein